MSRMKPGRLSLSSDFTNMRRIFAYCRSVICSWLNEFMAFNCLTSLPLLLQNTMLFQVLNGGCRAQNTGSGRTTSLCFSSTTVDPLSQKVFPSRVSKCSEIINDFSHELTIYYGMDVQVLWLWSCCSSLHDAACPRIILKESSMQCYILRYCLRNVTWYTVPA